MITHSALTGIYWCWFSPIPHQPPPNPSSHSRFWSLQKRLHSNMNKTWPFTVLSLLLFPTPPPSHQAPRRKLAVRDTWCIKLLINFNSWMQTTPCSSWASLYSLQADGFHRSLSGQVYKHPVSYLPLTKEIFELHDFIKNITGFLPQEQLPDSRLSSNTQSQGSLCLLSFIKILPFLMLALNLKRCITFRKRR